MSKLARHSAIRDLVNSQDVASQEELRRRLYRRGHRVTQATLSRDIHELRLVKTADGYSFRRETCRMRSCRRLIA